MRRVTSAEVAIYEDTCKRYARRYLKRAGAEMDDLVQEGMIACWEALRNGDIPSNTGIKRAMRDWVQTLREQGGR